MTVTIYTRGFCIWCWKAKRLLAREGVAFEERDAAAPETRAWLEKRTGRRTVPQIFAGEAALGGYDDLRALVERGRLRELVASSSP